MAVRVDTAALDRLIAEMPGKCAQLVTQGAMAVVGQAKAKAPVDTGALKGSIGDEKIEELLHHVAPGVEYAGYVELGTSRMAAQPYLGPAAESVRPRYEKSWRTLIK